MGVSARDVSTEVVLKCFVFPGCFTKSDAFKLNIHLSDCFFFQSLEFECNEELPLFNSTGNNNKIFI